MNRRPYIRHVPKNSWYLSHIRYQRYIAREITCLFIGAYSVIFTVGLWRLSESREAFNLFMHTLQNPTAIVFHCLAFVFSLYHSATWFNVTPQAMPIMRGDDFISGSIIVRIHYIAWAIISLVILVVIGA